MSACVVVAVLLVTAIRSTGKPSRKRMTMLFRKDEKTE